MMMIPANAVDRTMAVDWFIDDMSRGRLTIFDADAMLAQLRQAGDLTNLERLSRALSARGVN
jgi:hypothetical protein